jgi:hypothetical protein
MDEAQREVRGVYPLLITGGLDAAGWRDGAVLRHIQQQNQYEMHAP